MVVEISIMEEDARSKVTSWHGGESNKHIYATGPTNTTNTKIPKMPKIPKMEERDRELTILVILRPQMHV